MTDYVWPADIVPSASEWRVTANTAAFASPLSGTTRTVSRGGDRLAATLQFNNLTEAKRARLQAFLTRLRGQAHRVWIPDHGYRKRGSFPASELFTNNTFGTGTSSSWTAYDGNSTLTVADRALRIQAASGVAIIGAYQQAATTIGAAYMARTVFLPGTVSESAVSLIQILSVASSSSAGYGMRAVAGIATGTSSQIEVYSNKTGNHTSGDFFELRWASMARCALVYGASQTTANINVDALPISTAGLLLEGDRVQIGDELLTVAAALNSNGSGQGVLMLTRAPRATPADNAAVIVHEPLSRMMLAGQTVGWSNAPGGRAGPISSLTVEFIEDLVA